MRRSTWVVLVTVGIIWIWGGAKISAHEGRIVLKNATAACEGISIWHDDRYRIFGRCAGLVYPYQEKINNYVLWVQESDQAPRRVASINLGLFDGYTNNVFSQVFISVEEDSSPRQPGDLVIASGKLQPLDFGTMESKSLAPLAPKNLPIPIPTLAPVLASVFTAPAGLASRIGLGLAVLLGVFVAVMIAVFVVRRGH